MPAARGAKPAARGLALQRDKDAPPGMRAGGAGRTTCRKNQGRRVFAAKVDGRSLWWPWLQWPMLGEANPASEDQNAMGPRSRRRGIPMGRRICASRPPCPRYLQWLAEPLRISPRQGRRRTSSLRGPVQVDDQAEATATPYAASTNPTTATLRAPCSKLPRGVHPAPCLPCRRRTQRQHASRTRPKRSWCRICDFAGGVEDGSSASLPCRL
jgi:hypothetical protein